MIYNTKEVVMKKNTKKKNTDSLVSKKRKKEIEEVFEKLNIVKDQSYNGAINYSKSFKKVSLYDSEGIIYTTSGSSACKF